jgi:hypothetical protein
MAASNSVASLFGAAAGSRGGSAGTCGVGGGSRRSALGRVDARGGAEGGGVLSADGGMTAGMGVARVGAGRTSVLGAGCYRSAAISARG